MAAVEFWEHLFKPEVRKKGAEDFKHESVNFKTTSDTEIVAYVRSGSGYRVSFRAESIADPLFYVSCSCSAAVKGTLCKHIFTTLLATEIRHPDFFDSKTDLEIEILGQENLPGRKTNDSGGTARVARPETEATVAYKAQAKAKQADYRKQQYKKQKERKDTQKKSSKTSKTFNHEILIPDSVRHALDYFLDNGFSLEAPIDELQLKNAMKKLARIFHPDVGGSHEETVTLNQNYEIVLRFIS